MKEVNAANFEAEVLQSEVPVLVDFWAPWCTNCKSMERPLEQIEIACEGKAKVVKLNIEDEFELARKFGVRTLPTFIVFKGGESKDFVVGARPRAALEALLNKQL